MLLLLDPIMHRALGWLGRGSSIRALDLGNPALRDDPRAAIDHRKVERLDILGRLIHEYESAAA